MLTDSTSQESNNAINSNLPNSPVMAAQSSSNSNVVSSQDFYGYNSVYPPEDLVNFASLKSTDVIAIFIEANYGNFPTILPRLLKVEIENKLKTKRLLTI